MQIAESVFHPVMILLCALILPVERLAANVEQAMKEMELIVVRVGILALTIIVHIRVNIHYYSITTYHLWHFGCCVISATDSHSCNSYRDMSPSLLHWAWLLWCKSKGHPVSDKKCLFRISACLSFAQ